MSYNHLQYVPCLRWKQGEYQAVWRLPDKTKAVFTPLIEIPQIGWDFENAREAKTLDQHLAPFPDRVHQKWGPRSCFIDLHLIGASQRMTTGDHPVRFVFDQLLKRGCSPIPVVGMELDNAYQQEIQRVVSNHECGVCFRMAIERVAKRAVQTDIDSLLSTFGLKPSNCDFILDLGAPNFVPVDGFSKAIQAVVGALPHLQDWRTFALVGTSLFPTVAGLEKGPQLVHRYEWLLYKTLIPSLADAKLRLPAFGDYAISHPASLFGDMRLLKPSAKIRYTVDNGWYVVKGENLRDYGFEQYRDLSAKVVASRYFCGPAYSWGDGYLMKCADGVGRTGNLSTWVQVDTNHHIEKVTQDIASFYAS